MHFLSSARTFAVVVIVLCLPLLAFPASADDSYKPLAPLKLAKCQVEVGAEKPFKVVHVSDSHIVRVDNRDTEEIRAYALKRSYMERKPGCYYFGDHFWGEHYLEEAVGLARQEGAVIVHTGDMVTYYGPASLEYAGRRLASDDFIATVGNHEYWLAEDKKDVSANESVCLPGLEKAFGKGVKSYEREINGVVFFVFNNASQLVTKETVDAFERAVAKKKPLVLVCHVPLCTKDIHQSSCGWTDGKHDQLTVDFVERVRREPLVKAILAGHIHGQVKSQFSDTAVEFVADALFNGAAQEIVIK